MRTFILSFITTIVIYGCIEISAKDGGEKFTEATPVARMPMALVRADPRLRVGKVEAARMRNRRGSDDAAVKISAKDLQSLITGPLNDADSFIFYFVKYKEKVQNEESRYRLKVPGADWNYIVRNKPSSLLVGFVPGQNNPTGFLNHKRFAPVDVYDLGVLCPPPPDCNCEIAH